MNRISKYYQAKDKEIIIKYTGSKISNDMINELKNEFKKDQGFKNWYIKKIKSYNGIMNPDLFN